MKAFLWVVLLSIIGVSAYFMVKGMMPDDSRMISIAFGNEEGDQVDIHVELSMLMAQSDTWGYMTAEGNVDYNAWAMDHYIIKDSSGSQVDLRHSKGSNLISDKDTRGYHDSFLIGKVRKGEKYTFEYIPIKDDEERFGYEFVAPSDNAGRSRVSFQPL